MGYLIILPDTTDTVYFLSSDIISVNGIWYKIYGHTLANKFKSIIASDGLHIFTIISLLSTEGLKDKYILEFPYF